MLCLQSTRKIAAAAQASAQLAEGHHTIVNMSSAGQCDHTIINVRFDSSFSFDEQARIEAPDYKVPPTPAGPSLPPSPSPLRTHNPIGARFASLSTESITRLTISTSSIDSLASASTGSASLYSSTNSSVTSITPSPLFSNAPLPLPLPPIRPPIPTLPSPTLASLIFTTQGRRLAAQTKAKTHRLSNDGPVIKPLPRKHAVDDRRALLWKTVELAAFKGQQAGEEAERVAAAEVREAGEAARVAGEVRRAEAWRENARREAERVERARRAEAASGRRVLPF